MRSQVYFYEFDTKSKPGKIIGHGVRFESVEIDGANLHQTTFKILCDQHPELAQVPLSNFKRAIAKNFPSV